MSSHQVNKDKPRSTKCRHFCFPFDTHNSCPTCRESGNGDDPCVMFESLCDICAAFSEEQLIKITHRKRYVKKQKRDTTKDDELDLLGNEDVKSFTGSQADLESAAPSLDLTQTLRVLLQAQHFSTHRKVQNGNSRVHQDLPDSRGMGIVDRPIGHLPSHPHPPKLKEIPKVLPQVTGVPVHLPSFWTSHGPPGL